jgi:hypothetical protein
MKLKLYQSLPLRIITVGILALWIFSLGAAACDLAATVKDADVNDIKSFFDSQNHAYPVDTGSSSCSGSG